MQKTNHHHKTTRYSWNRRTAMLLACVLLFQAVFNGVEVHAQDTSSDSQTTVATAVPIPADSYTVTFDKTGAWDGYAQYSVTVTNTTGEPLENIALAAQWQDVEADAIWCATAQKKGDTLCILPPEWSAAIAPGSTFIFGIIIKGNNKDLTPPGHCALFFLEDIQNILLGQMLLPPWEQTAPEPGQTPTAEPTPEHTTDVEQTDSPIPSSSPEPTSAPTAAPTPSPSPTPQPTAAPTAALTPSPSPTPQPTAAPTAAPTPIPTATPEPTPTPTPIPTLTPAPTTPPQLTMEVAETQAAIYGYTISPQTTIRITNTGQGTSAPFTLELSAGETSPFTLTPPENNVLAGAEQATLLLTLKSSLNAGLYTDTLILHIPGQAEQAIPVLQQVNKLPVLEPAPIRIAAITADTVTLAEIPGYEYAAAQGQEQPVYQDSPVFAGLQPDTDYTLFMRKKEDKNHTAGQITTAEVRTNAIPAPEPSPSPEPALTPEPESTATPVPTSEPTPEPSFAPVPTPTPEPVEDLCVDGNLTLTKNTICRNLYMNGTSLDLNGYNLTVQGEVQHNRGNIYAENAENSFTVQGNYTQNGGELVMDGGDVTIYGDYEQNADSCLYMCGSKTDTLTIKGSWFVNNTHPNQYNYGTIRLHGNLTRTGNACKNQINQDSDTRIHLEGTGSQTIDLGTDQSGTLGILYLDNTAGVTFTRPLCARNIRGLANIANNSITLHVKDMELVQDETIHCDVTIPDGYYGLDGHNLTIEGSLTQNGGNIRAENAGNTLTVQGNYIQNGGELLMDGGDVTIHGDYEQNNYSRLYMCGRKTDLLSIRKNWTINTINSNVFNYGTIHLGSDLIQTDEAAWNSLQMDEDTTLRFTGRDEEQYVSLAYPDTSTLGKTYLDNPAGVYFDNKLRAVTIHGMPVCDTWDTLELEADTLKLTGDSTSKGNITINSDVDLAGHTWTIGGNLTHTGGTIYTQHVYSIEKTALHIKENYVAKSGRLDIGTGQVTIDGNYYLAGNAELLMQERVGNLTVNGNMHIKTTASHDGNLTAGALTLRGNLQQMEGSSQNSFVQSGSFAIHLDGTDTQKINILYPDESIFNYIAIGENAKVDFQSVISLRHMTGWENIISENLIISKLYLTVDAYPYVDYNGNLTVCGGYIDINGSYFRVGGDFCQADTVMKPGGGVLVVDGDYILTGTSTLHMTNPEDGVIVKGNFETYSTLSHQGLLSAGQLSIAGNFSQQGHERSFCATDEHVVFFSESDELSQAYFESPYTSGFAKVGGYYIGNNNKIWESAKIIANYYAGICTGAIAAAEELKDIIPDNIWEAGDLVATIGLFFGETAFTIIPSAIYLYGRAWYGVWENRGAIEYTEDKEELARQIGILVGGVLVVALLFELLDAKSGDIKAWVKSRLNDTTFINKVNTVVENSITKIFSKADQYALLSGKVEKVVESLKTSLSEEAFQYLKTNLQKDQISGLMEAVRKLEKELGSTELKLSEAQVKKLLEGLKDGKSVDSVVAELKTWCESGGRYTESEIKNIVNNLKGDGFKNNPLRQAYEKEVRGLKEYGEQLLADGVPEEQVARTLNQARRDLGVKYKDMTPQPLRDYIYEINMDRYGDKLGPTYEYMREEKGRSNMDIIKSSSRPNMNVDELLAGFEEWLWRQ